MRSNNIKSKEKLNQRQLALLQTEMDKKKRSGGFAYFLLVFFSVIGAHQLYLGHKLKALLFLLTQGGSLACFWAVIFLSAAKAATYPNLAGGVVILGFSGAVMWIYDLFTLSSQTDRANEEVELEIIDEIKAIS